MEEKTQKVPGTDASRSSVSNSEDLVPRIVGVDEAPSFLIDNKYLIRGYRKNFGNIKDILKSLFMAHNETWNIWTHLAGSLVLIWMLYYLFTVYLPHDSVVVHLKELGFKKPHLEDSLAELRARIPSCLPLNTNGDDGHSTGLASDTHLCSYIGSISNRKFDSSFSELHSSIVQGLGDRRNSANSKGLIDSILHAVDQPYISFIWTS
jgi:hypothetical protein